MRFFFFSSRRRHTRWPRDWSSDVCSSDLAGRGGGEWPAAELLVVAARGEDGALVGVAPLFQAANREGRPALLLVGAIEISDYLDFVVRSEVRRVGKEGRAVWSRHDEVEQQ